MKGRSWFKRKSLINFLMIIVIGLVVASCATQSSSQSGTLPGFFLGFLHGFLIPFSFIGSFVTGGHIYVCLNSGRWYDFGYFLGAYSFIGTITYSTGLRDGKAETGGGQS